MNKFYEKKAAIPREARTGDLSKRLAAWRDKRLLPVAAACDKSTDVFRKKFGSYHHEFASNVDSILSEDNEDMVGVISEWIEKLKAGFEEHPRGAQHDAIGLCGAELQSILDGYVESK